LGFTGIKCIGFCMKIGADNEKQKGGYPEYALEALKKSICKSYVV